MIFGINTTSDISKLLYVISRTVRRVKFETILKYHKWYSYRMSRTNHTIICYYYYPQKVCNFHMQVFQIKLKYHWSKPIKLQKILYLFSVTNLIFSHFHVNQRKTGPKRGIMVNLRFFFLLASELNRPVLNKFHPQPHSRKLG